jgi:site-specific recombinase XerD
MADAKTEIVAYDPTTAGDLTQSSGPVTARNAPAIVKAAGRSAEFACEEFFQAQIVNAHTHKNYLHAVRRPLAWAEARGLEMPRVSPGDVGAYLQGLDLAVPTKKLHLAALRRFFDRLVNRHACAINPAATVKSERYAVVEGKTPEIGPGPARTLLKSIDVSDPVGLRDRAVLAVLIYTAARVEAVAKLTPKNLKHNGTQYALRFSEKGGKSREIPVRHHLERFLLDYVRAAGIAEGTLFRTANHRTKTLTKNSMTGIDACRMMKWRLKAAGLPGHFSPHSFRVTTVTDLLEQNVPLENVQHLAGHSDPRTTRIYDCRRRKVAPNIVERISI